VIIAVSKQKLRKELVKETIKKSFYAVNVGKTRLYNSMYVVIYWLDDDSVKPLLNKNDSLRLFETLKEANSEANDITDSRVISIEAVKE